jgi:hypothetical protein
VNMDGLEQDTALLRELVEYAGTHAAAVAKKANMAPSTLQRPLNGTATTRLSQRTLEKLQEAYPAFPGWARALDAQPPVRRKEVSQPIGRDSLAIPMLELGYGMGGTFLDGIDPGEVIEHFPRAFVRMFTAAPEQLLCFSHGIGDSMYPTIGDRDVLLIDRSRDTISINDQIWVLSVGGIGMVKRVRMGGGKITLLSDNENVPDYDPGDDELQVIGRVIAVVRRI